MPTPGPLHGLSQTYKVLEIFCYGGLSHEETLWLESGNVPDWAGSWTDSDIGLSGATTVPVGSSGIHLGRMCTPLAGTSKKLRVVCLEHDLEPHTAAIPYALTGGCFGRPNTSGMGAAIESVHGSRTAFVLHGPGGRTGAVAAAQFGQHGSENQPVVLSVQEGGDAILASFLASRSGEADDLRDQLGARYGSWLDHAAGRVRSHGFDAFSASYQRAKEADLIAAMLGSASLEAPTSPDYAANATRVALGAAKELLDHGARYAAVIDNGVYENYDRHHQGTYSEVENATMQAGNLFSVLDELDALGMLADPNDGLLILINTEFGRSSEDDVDPVTHGRDGTEHAPEGYAVLTIGGPNATSGLVGDLRSSSSRYNPADLRAALYAAAGLDPLAEDMLLSGDLSPVFDASSTPTPTADIVDTFFLI